MQSTEKTRTEKDSMGTVQVPEQALYAAQTQRAINNFKVSDLKMPGSFIKALGLIKAAAATSNSNLNLLEKNIASAIVTAAKEVASGKYDSEFPIDVFQTGSGTSSNMNANEVIANLASNKNSKVHPNDHVNMSQSSNDVIPTAIHVSASIDTQNNLLPALKHLRDVITKKADDLTYVTKTGRTHLMDAMPVTMQQELLGWAEQINNGIHRVENTFKRITELAIGGTAVGTGINAHATFSKKVCAELTELTGIKFNPKKSLFEGISTQDAIVEFSGQLRTIAVSIMKIANDLRWMNSGPLSGLGEITLPAVQPGSSIMPGKINPVIPESVCMLAAQIMGNDTTIMVAGQSGNFQLNVMLPVIAYNILQSINILANGARMLADNAIKDFKVREDNITSKLAKNPILITALNSVIGYEKGAAIAKAAYESNRAILNVAKEMTDLDEETLRKLLNPGALTKGGIQS